MRFIKFAPAALVLFLTCLPLPAQSSSEERTTKPSFAVRHPKLHRVGRRIRRTCTVVKPIIETVGATAQIALLFVRK